MQLQKLSIVALAILALLTFASCTSTKDASIAKSTADDLVKEKKSVVIARFTTAVDYWQIRSQTAVKAGYDPLGTRFNSYRVRMYNLDTEEEVIAPPFFAFGDATKDIGWARFVVSSGNYYLTILPPDVPLPQQYRTGRPRNQFYFSVPDKSTVLYIGSFRAHCGGIKLYHGPRMNDCVEDVEQFNEDYLAANYAAALPSNLGSLQTQLAVPYHVWKPEGVIRKLASLSLINAGAMDIIKPDWDRLNERHEFQTHSQRPSVSLGGTGGGGFGAAAGTLALVAVVGIVAGASAIIDEVEEANAKKNWPKCLSKLETQIRERNVSGTLQSLVQAYGSGFIERNEGERQGRSGELEVGITKIHFRKCSAPNTICLEIIARATVRDPAGRVLYDRLHAFTNADAVPDVGLDRPYAVTQRPLVEHLYLQFQVEEKAECRSIGEFCGDNSGTWAWGELERGIRALADKIARDLGLTDDERLKARLREQAGSGNRDAAAELAAAASEIEPLRKLAGNGDHEAIFKLAQTTVDVGPLRTLAQNGDLEAGLLVARLTGDRDPFSPILERGDDVKRLETYLDTRKQEFLEKLASYEFAKGVVVGAGNDERIPKKLESYRVLGRKNGGFEVRLEIFYIRNYTSSYTKIKRVLKEHPDPTSALGFTFETIG